MAFANKFCIVTSVTSGIGWATAECLAQQGSKLLLVNKHEDRDRELVKLLHV